MLILVICGCSQDVQTSIDDVTDILDREYDVYLDAYLRSDIPEARDALIRTLNILETLDPDFFGYAHAKWLVYARLHYVERRAENATMETIYFQHAKYWFMRRIEARGMKPEDLVTELDTYTPERSLQVVNEWDSPGSK